MYLKIYTTDQLLLLQNLNPLLKKQIPGEVLRRITSLLVKEKMVVDIRLPKRKSSKSIITECGAVTMK